MMTLPTLILIVLLSAGLLAWGWCYIRFKTIKKNCLGNRVPIDIDEIYRKWFYRSNIPIQDFRHIWRRIGDAVAISPKLLRPEDKIEELTLDDANSPMYPVHDDTREEIEKLIYEETTIRRRIRMPRSFPNTVQDVVYCCVGIWSE